MAFFERYLVERGLLLQIEAQEERDNLRNSHRKIRDSSNPFELSEGNFRKLFRLNRQLAFDLCEQLNLFLPESVRSTYIPKYLKVLLTLNFYATGSYQGSVGDSCLFPCSQSTVSIIVETVTNAINNNLRQKIKFPTTPEEIRSIQQTFFLKFGFPNVLGCIDGTQVAIISPPLEHDVYPALAYYNRKGYTSINTLIICDAKLKILAINARHAGATHDSAIWQTSAVQTLLRNKYFAGELNGWLLGDSGFPLQPWLLTPVENAPEDTPEGRYTKLHCSTRNTVERLNGVLKGRFRCLLRHRCLHYLPPKATKIIYACAILHNMCIENNQEDEIQADDYDDEGYVHDDDEHHDLNINNLAAGRRIRNHLIQTHFA